MFAMNQVRGNILCVIWRDKDHSLDLRYEKMFSGRPLNVSLYSIFCFFLYTGYKARWYNIDHLFFFFAVHKQKKRKSTI